MPNGRYTITESVGHRAEAARSVEDLEKHRPSTPTEIGRSPTVSHAQGEWAFVRKDFILQVDGRAAVDVPSPVAGTVYYEQAYGTARIYDRPGPQGQLIAKVLHMDPDTFRLPNGARVAYGQGLGQQDGTGSDGTRRHGIHVRVETTLAHFQRYISDIGSGVIRMGQVADPSAQASAPPSPHSTEPPTALRAGGALDALMQRDQGGAGAHAQGRAVDPQRREAPPAGSALPATSGAGNDPGTVPPALTRAGRRNSAIFARGDQGENVRSLQGMFRKLGANIAVDGQFGPEMERVVRGYQMMHGLAADGAVGPQTMKAIRADLTDRTAATAAALTSPERSSDRMAGSQARGPVAHPAAPSSALLPPDQTHRLRLIAERLAPALSARGYSATQVAQISAAALHHLATHAAKGDAQHIMVSNDGQRIGVVHAHHQISEMPMEEALRHSTEEHLASASRKSQGQSIDVEAPASPPVHDPSGPLHTVLAEPQLWKR